MYVITVKFKVRETHLQKFMIAMRQQAEDSLTLEEHCVQFDVCQSTADPSLIFLYERYLNLQDFQDHLKSEHFKHFSETVSSWINDKTVESFHL